MKIVLDVNILLSALIKDSLTRKIIMESDFDFYFPEPSLNKMRKYEDYIKEKANLDKETYNEIIKNLFTKIKLTSREEIKKHWKEAKIIMENIDPEDVTFIATAMCLRNAIIWSDDKDFQKQEEITTLTTEKMIMLLKS